MHKLMILHQDLSGVKAGFKSVPLQFHFVITELASAKKWRKIQNIDGEERFEAGFHLAKIFTYDNIEISVLKTFAFNYKFSDEIIHRKSKELF